MKKWAYSFLAVLALVVITQSTALTAYDPPHDDANSIFCADCHGQSLIIAGGSPFWSDNQLDSAYNSVCARCHNDPALAPLVNSHAPSTIPDPIKCTTCHHNHEQDQVYPGKYNKANFFIATGTASSAVESGGVTTITVDAIQASNPSSDWAANLNLLADKTVSERGAMLIPSISATGKRWPIFMIETVAIDPITGGNPVTSGTITVKGDASAASDFGIFYGQLVRSTLRYGGVNYVEFYDNKGTYAWVNPATGRGICQVCHTATNHYQKIPGAAPGGDNHNTNVNCMVCHRHSDVINGFGASIDHDGDDAVNADGVVDYPAVGSPNDCGACHDGDVISGADTHNSQCTLCHDPDFKLKLVGETGGRVSSMPAYGAVDRINTCGDCHGDHLADWYYHVVDHEAKGWVGVNTDSSTYTLDCAYCHTQANVLTGIHDSKPAPVGSSTGCKECHTNSDATNPPYAIQDSAATHGGTPHGAVIDPSNECATCHTTYFGTHLNHTPTVHDVQQHPAPGPVPTPDLSDTKPCNDCHKRGGTASGNPLFTNTWGGVDGIYAMHTGGCVQCHDSTRTTNTSGTGVQDIILNNTAVGCLDCHADRAAGHGHNASHFSWAGDCDDCHSATPGSPTEEVVKDIHGDTCSLCHDTASGLNSTTEKIGANGNGDAREANGVATSTNGWTAWNEPTCLTCHNAPSYTKPKMHHASSNYTVNNECANCHNQADGHAGDHTNLVTSEAACGSCHNATAGGANNVPLDVADNKKHDACTTCHVVGAGNLVVLITPPSANGYVPTTMDNPDGTTLTNNGGGVCTDCHGSYFPNHISIDHSTSVALDTNTSAKNDCIDCHTGTQGSATTVPVDPASPAGDKKHDACSVCHDTDGSLKGAAAGNDGGTANGTDGGGDCTTCHGAYFDSHTHGNVGNHDLTYTRGVDLSQDAPGTYCGVCHYDETSTSASLDAWSGILYEHDLDGTKNGTGACVTCHDYSGATTADGTPPVAANDSIIASGTSNTCVSCHTPKIQPETHGLHESDHFSFDAACASCHNAILHGGGTEVVANIHNNDCNVCHSGTPNRNSEKNGDATNGVDGDARLANGTAALFDGGDANAWIDVTCQTCHPNAIPDTLTFATIHHDSKNDYAVNDNCTTKCHLPAQGNHSATVALATNCADCHDSTKGLAGGISTDAGDNKKHDDCVACHFIDTTDNYYAKLINPASSPLVTAMPDGGSTGGTNGGGTCEACHTQGFTFFHQTVDHDPMVDEYGNCVLCHADTDAETGTDNGRVPLDGADNKKHDTCSVCHHADGRLSGSADTHEGGNGDGGTDGGGTCFTCHGEYFPDHSINHTTYVAMNSNCNACHNGTQGTGTGVPLDPLATYAGNKKHDACASCHAATGALTNLATGNGGGANCQTCHDAFDDNHLTSVSHDPMVDADTGTPSKIDCIDCHTATAAPAGAFVMSTDADKHSACTSCHDADGTLTGSAANQDNSTVGGTDGGGICQDCHGAYFDSHDHGVDDGGGDTFKHIITYNQAVDTSQPSVQECAACHDDYTATIGSLDTWLGIAAEHDRTGTSRTASCSTCHNYTGAVTAGSTPPPATVYNTIGTPPGTINCSTCHTPKVPDVFHPDHLLNGWVTYASNCADCHTGHVISGVPAAGSPSTHSDTCAFCHTDPGGGDYSLKTGSSAAGHTGATPGSPNTCATCHGDFFNGGQTASPSHTGTHASINFLVTDPLGPNKCVDCHLRGIATPTEADVIDEVHKATGCVNCHNTNGTLRVGANNNGDATAAKGDTNNTSCGECHGGQGSTDNYSTFTNHDTGSGGDHHYADTHDHYGNAGATHIATTAECVSCHYDGFKNGTTNGAQYLLYEIHGNGVMGTMAGCTKCHTGMGPNGNLKTTTIGDASGGPGQCTDCHTEALTGMHGDIDTEVDDTGLNGINHDFLADSYVEATVGYCADCHIITSQANKLSLHGVTGSTGCLTCHASGIGAQVRTAILNGAAGTSTTCRSCHTNAGTDNASGTNYVDGTLKLHGLNAEDVGFSDHDKYNGSDSTLGYDCLDCHNDMGTVVDKLDKHMGGTPNDTSVCAVCHTAADDSTHSAYVGPGDEASATGNIDLGKSSHASPSTINCESCHVAKDAYLRHGLTADNGADGAVDVHNRVSTSGITGDTDCANCHSMADVTARLQLHTQPTNTAHTGNCLTCHVGQGDPADAQIADGILNNDVNCNECHTGKTQYLLHGLTSGTGGDGVSDVHDVFSTSTLTAEKDCANCHVMGTVTQRIDLHEECRTCHTNASPANPAGTVINNGWNSGTTANCESCHTGKGVYELHGLSDTDAADSDTVADVHDKLTDSTGIAPTFTNTKILLEQSDYSCYQCHDINQTVEDAAAWAKRIQVHTSANGTGSGTCLTCHNSIAGFEAVIDSGRETLHHVGGGSNTAQDCEACHNSTINGGGATNSPSSQAMYQYDGTRHHATEHAQAGDCTYCHADPRPQTGDVVDTDPGWAGTADLVGDETNGWTIDYSMVVTPREKQLACRLCHSNYDADDLQGTTRTTTGLIIYQNSYTPTTYTATNSTSWGGPVGDAAVGQTAMTSHTITSGSKIQVENYGACLSCHSIQIWHAKPTWNKGDNSCSLGNGSNGNGFDDECDRDDNAFDALRQAPGRTYFANDDTPDSDGNDTNAEKLKFNIFSTGATTGGVTKVRMYQRYFFTSGSNGKPYDTTDSESRGKDFYKDYRDSGSNPWMSNICAAPNCARFTIPDNNTVTDGEGLMSSDPDIPYFTNVPTLPAIDYITVTSAVWDGTTLSVTVTSSLGAGQTLALDYSDDSPACDTAGITDDGGGNYSYSCNPADYSVNQVETVTVTNTGASGGGSRTASVVNNNIPVNAVADSYTITSIAYTTTLSVMSNDTGIGIYVSAVDNTSLNANCTASINADPYVGVDITCTGTGTGDWGSFDYTITGANSDTSTATVSITRANLSPTLSISQPSGDADVPGSYDITYTLVDIEEAVTVDFYYDTTGSGFSTTNPISGACTGAAEGTGVTCSWNTSALADNTYYVWGEADDGVNPVVQVYAAGSLAIVSNNPPNAVNDGTSGTAYTTVKADSGVNQITGLLANDDAGGDGGALTIDSVSGLTCDGGVSNHDVAINADNVSVDFTAPDGVSNCSFDYTISDTFSTSTAATVYVEVTPACGISIPNDWSIVSTGGAAGTDNNTYSISAGNNRLLVVSIGVRCGTGTCNNAYTVSYGNQPMTFEQEVDADRIGSYLAYLDEDGISNATDSILRVTTTANGTGFSGYQIRAMVLEGVNQFNPLTPSGHVNFGNGNNYTTAAFTTPNVTFDADDRPVVGLGGYNDTITASAPYSTPAGTDWGSVASRGSVTAGPTTEGITFNPTGGTRYTGTIFPIQSDCYAPAIAAVNQDFAGATTDGAAYSPGAGEMTSGTDFAGAGADNCWFTDTNITGTGVNNTTGNPPPYIYRESSTGGTPNCGGFSTGDNFWLESPDLDATSNDFTMSFDWNYESDDFTGFDTLAVYYSNNGTTGPWLPKQTITNTRRGATAAWTTTGVIDLSTELTASNSRVRIQITAGTNNVSHDIVIDNIQILGY